MNKGKKETKCIFGTSDNHLLYHVEDRRKDNISTAPFKSGCGFRQKQEIERMWVLTPNEKRYETLPTSWGDGMILTPADHLEFTAVTVLVSRGSEAEVRHPCPGAVLTNPGYHRSPDVGVTVRGR